MAEIEQKTSSVWPHAWYHRRDIRFLILTAVCLLIFYGYGFVTGPSRITKHLQNVLDENPPRINILVTSKFPPEAFHIGIYQDLGNMRGSEGNTAIVFRVQPSDIRTLSRYYWIEKIDLASPIKN